MDTRLAVIGAGPCGLAVGMAARRAGVPCVLIDKNCVAASIAGYPTFMTFFSTADRLEIGGVPFITANEKPTRREALRYYQRIAREFELDVRQFHTVTSVERCDGRFQFRMRAHTGRTDALLAENVVIATGYFDSPNLLGVPGEDLAKVAHRYAEGHPYYAQDVLIVGGGNSAVNAALELYRWGARVTLVHFEEALDPGVKPWVLPDITARIRDGAIRALWRSRVVEIAPEHVVVQAEPGGDRTTLPNDWVLAMTGYTPDPRLLRALGVRIDEHTGIPDHEPASMRTNVSGVYIAGVIAAGNDANKVFIENGRDHGERIVRAVAGD